jgi:hypothetical protein
MIELGDKVKCKHTGFTGIAVSRTEFINGCVQYGVVPKVTKENKYPDEMGIDEDSLEKVGVKKKTVKKKATGGPARVVTRRNF